MALMHLARQPGLVSGCRAAAVAALLLVTAGCSLRPGCGNREVRAGIERDAKASTVAWVTSMLGPQDTSGMRVAVTGTYETAREANTRACSATVVVNFDQTSKTEVPIEYEVIQTDDGQSMYRWDSAAFGRSLITATITSTVVPQSSSQAETPSTGHQADLGSEAAQGETDKRDQQIFDRWHDRVTEEVNAQAANFRIEGSGSVSLTFTVSAAGSLSDIRVVQGSGNAELDWIAIKMVEKAKEVQSPPNRKAISFLMKISFL